MSAAQRTRLVSRTRKHPSDGTELTLEHQALQLSNLPLHREALVRQRQRVLLLRLRQALEQREISKRPCGVGLEVCDLRAGLSGLSLELGVRASGSLELRKSERGESDGVQIESWEGEEATHVDNLLIEKQVRFQELSRKSSLFDFGHDGSLRSRRRSLRKSRLDWCLDPGRR